MLDKIFNHHESLVYRRRIFQNFPTLYQYCYRAFFTRRSN